jgi:hypothetical protein
VLINEYRPGARIGWHRDKAQFNEVVGVSLLAPSVLRFCRKAAETWDRVLLAVEPRSAYLLSGAARTVWEHSIPALDQLRYSITMRTHIAKGPSGEERSALLSLCSFRLYLEKSHKVSDRTVLTRMPVVTGA